MTKKTGMEKKSMDDKKEWEWKRRAWMTKKSGNDMGASQVGQAHLGLDKKNSKK